MDTRDKLIDFLYSGWIRQIRDEAGNMAAMGEALEMVSEIADDELAETLRGMVIDTREYTRKISRAAEELEVLRCQSPAD